MTPRRTDRLQPPIAAREPVTLEHHGHRRVDPYTWLRADNWREAMTDPAQLPAAIRDYLDAENRYAEAVTEPTRDLRAHLLTELRGRLCEDDRSVPHAHGPWLYYSRYREGEQHPLIARCPRDDESDETVLIDGAAEARGHDYFRLIAAEHSRDHRHLACALDTNGDERCRIRVRDLTTGDWLASDIDDAQGDLAWAADGRHLYYTRLDESHRPRWVRCRDIDSGEDTLAFEETDPGFFVGVDLTESGAFICIVSRDPETTEVRVIDAAEPGSPPRCLLAREPGVEYSATHHASHTHEDCWVILSNRGGADDYRIVTAPIDEPTPAAWTELVPHRPGILIHDLLDFRDYLVRLELEDAQPRIVVRRWHDGHEHAIAFDDPVCDLDLIPGLEYDSTNLRLGYSTLAIPDRVHDYDMAAERLVLRKEQVIPSGHDPADYVTHRLFAPAADGESIPISLIHHRALAPDDDTPLLLTAYGAYGLSELPAFSPHRFGLIDRGFVYAIAHVRGGREKGDRWYRTGKLEYKNNSFDDAIAAAKTLIEQGWTGPARIALQGGSAGGMLVGAVINRRPELFHAAVADVPFVDVLTTMLDPELPLTPPEWPEWGNPVTDVDAYHRLLGYSPCDNVTVQDYPHLLVTAGVADPRVTYWEPAKWVARLRACKTDDRLLALRTNMSAGHGGAAGRFDRLEEIGFQQAFLLQVFDRIDTACLDGARQPPV